MRHPLKRYYGEGDLHFITFSCYQRRPLLSSPAERDTFVRILDEIRCRHRFALLGFVVMPEHVHLVVSEAIQCNPSKILQVVKQKVSQELRAVSGTPHFWQRRFYDFNVRSEKKLKEKLDYMHANPIERKPVAHPRDWPWSSWTHYALGEKGLIAIDVLRPVDVGENPHP
jgi:putative transposase